MFLCFETQPLSLQVSIHSNKKQKIPPHIKRECVRKVFKFLPKINWVQLFFIDMYVYLLRKMNKSDENSNVGRVKLLYISNHWANKLPYIFML